MESKNKGTLKSMTCTFLFVGTETQLGGYPGLNRAGSEQATGVSKPWLRFSLGQRGSESC